MEVEGYILAISGTEKMFPAISEIFSPILRFFKRINVGNFKEIKETEECLLKPLNDEEKKAFDKSCILDIHQLSNGSPYEINLIAHYMYRRWREGKNPKMQLSPEVLNDVLNELERLREAEQYEIANKIRNYWRDDLKILISLLEFPKVPEDWLVEYMLLDEILYLKSLSLANIGRDEEAINCLDKALELNPDFISALLVKGEILLNRSHYEEALDCCDKVLEKEEANIAALGLKAIVLSKLNRYEDAIKCCVKFLKLTKIIH